MLHSPLKNGVFQNISFFMICDAAMVPLLKSNDEIIRTFFSHQNIFTTTVQFFHIFDQDFHHCVHSSTSDVE